MKKLVVIVCVLMITSMAHAAIMDNGAFTTDTNLGLDYLDVGLVFGDYNTFLAGVGYGGRTWHLATTAQIASTWFDATGLGLTVADIESGDNDMGFAATNILINLFDGVTTDTGLSGERVIGQYPIGTGLNNYGQFVFGGALGVHDQFDDSHFYQTTDGTASAWLVSAVPEPGTLALLGLGLLGLGASRKMRK